MILNNFVITFLSLPIHGKEIHFPFSDIGYISIILLFFVHFPIEFNDKFRVKLVTLSNTTYCSYFIFFFRGEINCVWACIQAAVKISGSP